MKLSNDVNQLLILQTKLEESISISEQKESEHSSAIAILMQESDEIRQASYVLENDYTLVYNYNEQILADIERFAKENEELRLNSEDIQMEKSESDKELYVLNQNQAEEIECTKQENERLHNEIEELKTQNELLCENSMDKVEHDILVESLLAKNASLESDKTNLEQKLLHQSNNHETELNTIAQEMECKG